MAEDDADNAIKTEVKDRKGHSYSVSATTVAGKKQSRTVYASKSVDEVSDNQTIITTTVKDEIKGKTETRSDTDVVIDTYSENLGYSQKQTTFSRVNQTDKKGTVKHSVEEYQEQNRRMTGAVERASGYTEAREFKQQSRKEYSFNAKGQMVEKVAHESLSSPNQIGRSDERIKLADNGKIKEAMQAEVRNAEVKIASIKKDDFRAHIQANGERSYSWSKNKANAYEVTEVSVDRDGKVSGVRYTMAQRQEVKDTVKADRDNAQKSVLSLREAEVLHAKMQKRADKVIAAVSEVGGVEAYQEQGRLVNKPKLMPLKNYFERQDEAKVEVARAQVRTEQAQGIEENKKLTTEQIVQNKLKQNQHKR